MYCTVPNSPGDHRAIIVDIDLVATIGEPRFRVVRPQGRRLNCSLPHVQQAYVKYFEKFAQSHWLEEKLTQLFQFSTQPEISRPALQDLLEKFDQLKAEGMRYAEKRCRRLHVGEVQFSPELNIWRQRRDLWLMVIK